MAKYTGWKRRYSYLNDYKKGMDGQYVYYGRHYVLKDDSRSIVRYKWILGITDILLTALFVIGGLMDAGAVWGTWYVVIPFALEAVVVFLLIWKSVTLITEKVPLKEYMYKRTVPWFKPLAWILAGVCLVSVVATLICLLVNPEEVRLTGCILYIVIKVLSAAVAIISILLQKGYEWQLDPSEEME